MQKCDVSEKKEKKLEDINREIDGLIYQKVRAIENFNTLIKSARDKRAKLLRIECINKKNSFSVISYLVSEIESVDCSILEIPVMLYEENTTGGKGSFQEYILACLVRDNNKEAAIDEIKKKFSCEFINNSFDVYGNRVNSFLSVPSDNYIQIAYYKKNDEFKDIKYSYNKDFRVIDLNEEFISSKICDERYFYIIDYINTVISYRLDKYDDIKFFEMKVLADIYVDDYRKNNGSTRSLVNHNN